MKKLLLIPILALAISAQTLDLKSCKSCHGLNYEKNALGKSKDISKMSEKEIKEALLGYKNKTYGGLMKNLMENSVKDYSEEEIELIAKQIKN